MMIETEIPSTASMNAVASWDMVIKLFPLYTLFTFLPY